MLTLAQDVIDYGNVPEIYVTNIARIEIVAGDMRFSFFSERMGGKERQMALHLIWSAELWIASQPTLAQVRRAIVPRPSVCLRLPTPDLN